MEDLESLQSLGWDVGYRESMIYLYRLSAHLSGMTLVDQFKAAQQFNSKFKQPLHPHRVETQCKPSDYNQKFKNTTIREKLGLSEIANLPVNEAVRTFISYFLLDEILPLPTYIEVGRNFKLVYILDHPFIIPKTVAKKKRESIFTFFRRIIQVISETIQNAGCGDWGVDAAYKIAPYLRVPESYNVKWDESDFKFTHQSQFKNMFNPDFEKGFQPKSVDEVYISEFSNWNTWDIDKLADTVLPPIDESWYYDYKEKQNKKPKQKKPTVQKLYSKNLFKQRMEDLDYVCVG